MNKESYHQSRISKGGEEEKSSSQIQHSAEKKIQQTEMQNEMDDRILLEFKKKYQKSLEAIQSFQEILDLKKNYGNITHSYYPVLFCFLAFG